MKTGKSRKTGIRVSPSREELILDIIDTKVKLNVDYLSQDLYDKNGKYSLHWAKKVFGSWSNAFSEVFNQEVIPFRGETDGPGKPEINCWRCGKITQNEKFCSRYCMKKYNYTRRQYSGEKKFV